MFRAGASRPDLALKPPWLTILHALFCYRFYGRVFTVYEITKPFSGHVYIILCLDDEFKA